MTNQVIPEAAVEAAAGAAFQFMEDQPWEAASPEETDFFRDAARKGLEAAAPHMLAEAWEAGHRTCRLDPGSIKYNPYRRTDMSQTPD